MLRRSPLPAALSGRESFVWLATWGHSGRLMPAPGSWGSLAALPFCYVIKRFAGDYGLLAFAIACLLAGLWAIPRYVAHTANKDPGEIVIDEVVGMAVTCLFIPLHFAWLAAAYLLFRIFDAVKYGPVGWCDKYIPGAWGVMVDDVMAGLMAGGVLCIWVYVFIDPVSQITFPGL